MKISIVTISYNQAQFLEEAIQSIVNQDYENVEYIVVDPGSTDGSREIIEKYKERIDRIVYDPDDGPADGLNKGFALATGDIFGFINADDALLPGALGFVANCFISKMDIDVLCGGGLLIDKTGKEIRKIVPTRMTRYAYVYGAVTTFQQGMFFKKNAFRAINGFNIENRTCWDGELLLDFLRSGKRFFFTKHSLGAYRWYETSLGLAAYLSGKQHQDKQRMFREVMGREHCWIDHLFGAIFRVGKLIFNPQYTALRIGQILSQAPLRLDKSQRNGLIAPKNK